MDQRQHAGNSRALLETLESLTPQEVIAIDHALTSLGAFGEVRLVKIKGRVRFIQQLKSNDLQHVCEVAE
jgi:hypothetical protein